VDDSFGFAYVVLELGQYRLTDYLEAHLDINNRIPLDHVRGIVKHLVLIVAGMHAKGFVHLNLKPDNFVCFDGHLKLTSLDSCVSAESIVSAQDSMINYSPAYCSPEWARFVHGHEDSDVTASPAYDVWSLGMTICELVIEDTVMKQMYSKFLKSTQSHRKAGFEYMAWLSQFNQVPLPKEIKDLDSNLFDLLKNWILVSDVTQRKTMIQCLSHPYCEGGIAFGRQMSNISKNKTPSMRTHCLYSECRMVQCNEKAVFPMVVCCPMHCFCSNAHIVARDDIHVGAASIEGKERKPSGQQAGFVAGGYGLCGVC